MKYAERYDSPMGPMMMVSDGTALTELRFSDTGATAPMTAASHPPELPVFQETRRWLDTYFNGGKPQSMPQLKPQGTSFQQMVWQRLMEIPYGKTATYGTIARIVGCRSAQAVGGTVGRNPIAILIPCHRVVGSDGSLTGYAYGLDRKRQLLLLEKNLSIGLPLHDQSNSL